MTSYANAKASKTSGDGPKAEITRRAGYVFVAVRCHIVDKLEAYVAGGGELPVEPDPGPRTYSHGPKVAVRIVELR